MIGRVPRTRSRLASTAALLALTLQTVLPLLHTTQLDADVVAPPLGCGHFASDGASGSHSLGVDVARTVSHDAEQCGLCQAIQQGKRTVVPPGATGPAYRPVRPADPAPSVAPAAGPTLRTTAPRGPPLDS